MPAAKPVGFQLFDYTTTGANPLVGSSSPQPVLIKNLFDFRLTAPTSLGYTCNTTSKLMMASKSPNFLEKLNQRQPVFLAYLGLSSMNRQGVTHFAPQPAH
ncbi:hypothetical protein [Pseudomonas mandelii]|uniref:hypothetical protein n=1 Tax=Pseudomonas mandelii TaxID=75612 RepID=UPI0012B2694F|nr:hypothetical protein [Pseudomonas mandelii]